MPLINNSELYLRTAPDFPYLIISAGFVPNKLTIFKIRELSIVLEHSVGHSVFTDWGKLALTSTTGMYGLTRNWNNNVNLLNFSLFRSDSSTFDFINFSKQTIDFTFEENTI
jgi:hypothetical protein